MAGTYSGGFSSRQVSSSYSPSYTVSSSLASAFLPAALNLNFHLSQKTDFGLLENRILRRALSTTLLGGGVTLSYYASGIMKQRMLDSVYKAETSFVDGGLRHPAVREFKWQKSPARHLSNEDSSTPMPVDEIEHKNFEGTAGNKPNTPERPSVIFENSADENLRVSKSINGLQSIFVIYLDTMKPIQTQLEGFATTLLSSHSRTDDERCFASSWSVLALFIGLYYLIMANRRQYQASLASTQIPQAMQGGSVGRSLNANGRTQPLGTVGTRLPSRLFLSDRGVPLKLPLFAHNGKLLFTLDEMVFRDSRLDPYGVVLQGGSGSSGAKAALLGPTGVNYTELCFRSSGIDPNWKMIKATHGAAPRLTSLAMIALTELEQPVNTPVSLSSKAISSCGWIGATFVKLIVGIVVFVIISAILLLSLPVQLLAFFFFTQIIMEIDEKVQDGQLNGTANGDAPRVMDVRNGKRLAKKNLPLRPTASASTVVATSQQINHFTALNTPNAAAKPYRSPTEVLDLGDLVIPIAQTPVIAVVPATPSLDDEPSTASNLDDLKLCATLESFLVEEDPVANSLYQTGDVSDDCVSVDVEKVALSSPCVDEYPGDAALTDDNDIYEQPLARPDPPGIFDPVLVEESSTEDITVIAFPIPEAFAGFESMDATILVSRGSSDESMSPSPPILENSTADYMQELEEVDRDHLSALTALELAINGKNTADRQKVVDDVVEAHIRSVEERADRTLTTSMWSGSFQSNAQLLSSVQAEQRLPGPDKISVAEDKANIPLGGKISHIRRAGEGAPTELIELASLPVAQFHRAPPCSDAPKTSSSPFSFTFAPSSTQAGPSTLEARTGRPVGEGRAQVQRGAHWSGVGRRWGAPAQVAQPKAALASVSAAKKRMVDRLPVPDWSKA